MRQFKVWAVSLAICTAAVSLLPAVAHAARQHNEYFSMALPDDWEEPMSNFLGRLPYPSSSFVFYKPRTDSAVGELIEVYASDWSKTAEFKRWSKATMATQSIQLSTSCMDSVRRVFTDLKIETPSRSCKAAGIKGNCVDWNAQSNGVATAGTCIGLTAANGMALWIRASDAAPYARKTLPGLLSAIRKIRLNKRRIEPAAG